MNSWSNAIIASIILIAITVLIVSQAPQPVEPIDDGGTDTILPGPPPAEQAEPVESADASFWKDARGAIAMIGRSPEVMMILSKAFEDASRVTQAAKVSGQNHPEPPPKEPTVEPPRRPATTKWIPTERQIVLYFYGDGETKAHATAINLIREGHSVYRAAPGRNDLYRQFGVRTTPTWLVVRDGRVIYRSQSPPKFPGVKPVRKPARKPSQASAPVIRYSEPIYYSAPSYRSYQGATFQGFRGSCAGGVCQ